MYGCELWNLTSGYVEKFKIAWRKVKRRIWKLPRLTHNSIVHNLSSDLNILLENRILKFTHNALRHNILCKTILQVKLRCKNSCFADNYRFLSHKYNLCDSDWKKDITFLMGKVKMKQIVLYPTSPEASIVSELCSLRDKSSYGLLSYGEITLLIDDISVH